MPTKQQQARYNELRNSGKSAAQANLIVSKESKSSSGKNDKSR